MNDFSENILEMHAIVKGDVQGVGFRAFTRQIALKLNLQGTVRNLENGDVEIYARGLKKHLQQLLDSLRSSHVGVIYSLEVEYTTSIKNYRGFQITF